MPSDALTWPSVLLGAGTAAGVAVSCVWTAAQLPLGWLPTSAVVGAALLASCLLTWTVACCDPATRQAAWWAGLAFGANGALFLGVDLLCRLSPIPALLSAVAWTGGAALLLGVLVACGPSWLLLRAAAWCTRLAGRLALRAALGR